MDRIEAFKHYLTALKEEGVFKGCRHPTDYLTVVTSAVGRDLGKVLVDTAGPRVADVLDGLAKRLRGN